MCEIEIWNFGPFKFCVIVELDENRFEDLDQETKNVATSKSNSARKSTIANEKDRSCISGIWNNTYCPHFFPGKFCAWRQRIRHSNFEVFFHLLRVLPRHAVWCLYPALERTNDASAPNLHSCQVETAQISPCPRRGMGCHQALNCLLHSSGAQTGSNCSILAHVRSCGCGKTMI